MGSKKDSNGKEIHSYKYSVAVNQRNMIECEFMLEKKLEMQKERFKINQQYETHFERKKNFQRYEEDARKYHRKFMETIVIDSPNADEISFYQIGFKFLEIPDNVICFGDPALIELETETEKFTVNVWLMDGSELFVQPILYFYQKRLNRFVITNGETENKKPY